MNILAALFLVILVCFQKSPPFCLPLNHHHQSSIINLLSCLFTIAHEYKMFQSYKCLVLWPTSSGKSMSDTEHDSFSSEMVNQDRNTVFTHTTLSHTVHTSQGHILPLSGVTCKDNATHVYIHGSKRQIREAYYLLQDPSIILLLQFNRKKLQGI